MAFADDVERVDREAQRLLGGVEILYAPQVGVPVPVTGIFDAQYVLAKGDAEAGVESTLPAVFFRLSDLPVDPEDDEPTLTITGSGIHDGDYRVIEREPDGMGGIVLGLRLIT